MTRTDRTWSLLRSHRVLWLFLLWESAILAIAWMLRPLQIDLDPIHFGQLQVSSGVLALITGACALIRFRGTHQRLALILGCGFALVGMTLASSSAVSFQTADSNIGLRDPMTWVIGRTFLAVLLVAGLVVDWHIPRTRNTGREISVALILVVISATLLSVAHGRLPGDIIVSPGGVFPRPGNLFPAGLFILATIGYHRRLDRASSLFNRYLYLVAGLNVACCLAASQSEHRLDAPFTLAEILQCASYAVLLGSALLDNLQMFQDVQQKAVTDPLTGLANYGVMVDKLEGEIQRSRRTGRPFSLLLFDVDGLKKLNDNFGHLAGSAALCRVAAVLRVNSRSVDTAIRYGGDEFALILPETGGNAAQEVAGRICDLVTRDGQQPSISVSGGVATYARDGETLESLLRAADQALYRMKRTSNQTLHIAV